MDETNAITPDRRHINLTQGEREELARRRQIELAVSLFLDLDQDRTVAQIAQEMNVSVSALKRLTKDPEFQTIYDETLMGLGHHPRLQAMVAQLPELLPLSFRTMKRLLGANVAATAQVAAVKLLWDSVGIGDQRMEEDPALLGNFLKSAGIKVEGNVVINANLPVPPEYLRAFGEMFGGEVVDATDVDTDTAVVEDGSANTDPGASPALSPTSETPALPPPGGSE